MNIDVFENRLSELYQPPAGEFTIVDMPEMKYMMIDGSGDPEGGDFKAAVKWLFSIAHFIKPHIKEKLGKRFVEPPMECLFWSDGKANFSEASKDKWRWRVMIVVLEYVTEDFFQNAVEKVAARLGAAPSSLALGYANEGKCVQTKHVGDYAGVEAVCKKLYGEYLPANRLRPSGPYHEIYLNDPDRVAPEKRQIVIRQPVA
jgi:hypothetical protein